MSPSVTINFEVTRRNQEVLLPQGGGAADDCKSWTAGFGQNCAAKDWKPLGLATRELQGSEKKLLALMH